MKFGIAQAAVTTCYMDGDVLVVERYGDSAMTKLLSVTRMYPQAKRCAAAVA